MEKILTFCALLSFFPEAISFDFPGAETFSAISGWRIAGIIIFPLAHGQSSYLDSMHAEYGDVPRSKISGVALACRSVPELCLSRLPIRRSTATARKSVRAASGMPPNTATCMNKAAMPALFVHALADTENAHKENTSAKNVEKAVCEGSAAIWKHTKYKTAPVSQGTFPPPTPGRCAQTRQGQTWKCSRRACALSAVPLFFELLLLPARCVCLTRERLPFRIPRKLSGIHRTYIDRSTVDESQRINTSNILNLQHSV